METDNVPLPVIGLPLTVKACIVPKLKPTDVTDPLPVPVVSN